MNSGIALLDKLPLRELGLRVQSLFPAGRHSDLLKRIEVSLLLFDDILINTANGRSEKVSPADDIPMEEAMAGAAKRLLHATANDCHILLLLPTQDFIATSYNMSVTGEKLLRSALELQVHTLIPAYDEKLLLGVDAARQDGVALWFNEREANRLFRAFEQQGLFLAAIMPRSLALLDTGGEEDKTLLINDEENGNISFLQAQGSSVRRLLTVNRKDLEQEIFAKQWDIETSQLKGEGVKTMTSLEDWLALRCTVDAIPAYSFMPAGAVEEEKRIRFARTSRVAMAVAACLVLLLFAPFISNWLQVRELQAALELAQEQSQEPRSLQASIFDMEQEWGALYEYPDQQIANVLVSLNDVIQSSLTSFSINKGVVDITGSADNPAYLVELLAEKEEFYNVGQSTAARGSGSQFGIRLNLSSVDFEAYEEKYPLITQGR